MIMKARSSLGFRCRRPENDSDLCLNKGNDNRYLFLNLSIPYILRSCPIILIVSMRFSWGNKSIICIF